MDNPETLTSLSTQATIRRETNNTNVKTHEPQTNTKSTVHALANSKQLMSCATLLADLFLCSYESEFLQKLVKDKKIQEARAFNFTYRYINDVFYLPIILDLQNFFH